MKSSSGRPHELPHGGMLFIRGQCLQCGKLSPPVYYDPTQDCIESLYNLRELCKGLGWYIDIFRIFRGPKPGTKLLCRCKLCDKEFRELSSHGESETVTMVTSMDGKSAV